MADPAFASYLKSTLACAAVALGMLLVGVVSLATLPRASGVAIATAAFLLSTGAAIPSIAGVLVLARQRRLRDARPDLFLVCNRSREPEAIRKGAMRRISRLRRWLARRLLGHDFLVGDSVKVKTWDEIRATLDASGCLDRLPFMPEMLPMCGKPAVVFRCMHRLFDYRKSRRMRHMEGTVLLVGAVCDGSSHGGCEAACHMIWKASWLRRVEPAQSSPARTTPAGFRSDISPLKGHSDAVRYECQLTQLHAGSRPSASWSLAEMARPLVAGNVTLAAFAVGWLTWIFDEMQHRRGGVGFPVFEAPESASQAEQGPSFNVGDSVVVRRSGEIVSTLDERGQNRGLWFEPDMLKHCNRRHRVASEVRQLIDIVSGEMRTMKTPAYILKDVHFSGERQLFNAQYEPLFWRAAWLQRDENTVAERGDGVEGV